MRNSILILLCFVTGGLYAQEPSGIREGVYAWLSGGKYYDKSLKLVIKKLNDTAFAFALGDHVNPLIINSTSEEDVYQLGIAQKTRDGKWKGIIDQTPMYDYLSAPPDFYDADKPLRENTSWLRFYYRKDTLLIEGYGGSDVFHGKFISVSKTAMVDYSITQVSLTENDVKARVVTGTRLYQLPGHYLPKKETLEKGATVYIANNYMDYLFVILYNEKKKIQLYGWIDARNVNKLPGADPKK